MTEKRFKRYLLDGGFWFDEYIKPVWSITDTENKDNAISFIEFKDEYKDLCDEIVNELNNLHEEKEIAIDGIKIADELIKKYGSEELKHEWKKEVTVKY